MVERKECPRKTLPLEVSNLYNSYWEKTIFLDDFTPIARGVNLNQRQAAEGILTLISESEEGKKGLTIGLLGTMWAGKTATICLLARDFKGFDFDFRREPWRNTEILLPLLDQVFILQARCEGCGAPAYFSQRDINGQPAHVDDPLVMVGAEELYTPKCGRCHQVRGK